MKIIKLNNNKKDITEKRLLVIMGTVCFIYLFIFARALLALSSPAWSNVKEIFNTTNVFGSHFADSVSSPHSCSLLWN